MPPLSLLIKPASGNCNMRCKYCFYVDEMEHREVANHGIMSEDTLYMVLKRSFDYVEDFCTIAFQGGEPTLAGLPYFKKMVEYVEELNVNQCKVNFALQTNGYMLDEEWVDFFHQHEFLIGISLDGIQEVHDQYRIDANGNGTFDTVMNSIELLKKHQVEFNILTVVHRETAVNMNKIYNFYKRNGLRYQQYIECLDPIGKPPGEEEYSLTPDLYGDFLVASFKKWYRDMREGKYVYNRFFENLLGLLCRQMPESCAMAGVCGRYLCIEADGSAYPCDFYVLDEWKLGNLVEDSVDEINARREELAFVQQSLPIPDECGQCKWYPLCRNGCRRNCEPTNEQERSRNYFCKSYQQFYEYAYPFLEELVQQFQQGQQKQNQE